MCKHLSLDHIHGRFQHLEIRFDTSLLLAVVGLFDGKYLAAWKILKLGIWNWLQNAIWLSFCLNKRLQM